MCWYSTRMWILLYATLFSFGHISEGMTTCKEICSNIATEDMQAFCEARICEIFDDIERQKIFSSIAENILYRASNGGVLGNPGKRQGFLRIGRGGLEDTDLYNVKRAGGFLRIGKSFDEDSKRTPLSKLRDDDMGGVAKRAPNAFLRIGKKDASDTKRASSFLRIGKDLTKQSEQNNETQDKRASSFLRIGKSINKRGPNAFLRIGKKDDDDDDGKRASSFLRIGKKSDDSMPNKRAFGFVRIGRDALDPNAEKRANSFVRIGGEQAKRQGFLRIGKSVNDKRQGFLRIGK